MPESEHNSDLSHIDFNDKDIIGKLLKNSKKVPDKIINLPNGNYIFNDVLFKTEQEVISFCLDQKNNIEKTFFDDGRLIIYGQLFNDESHFE